MFALDEPCAVHCQKSEPVPGGARAELKEEPALGAAAMSIVHDLRSPLAAIHSGAEMLHGSGLAEHDVRRLAQNIYKASIRIQELLQDYIDLCRRKKDHPESSNLRSLVAHAVERIAHTAEAQSVFVVQDVPADLVVKLDRRRIASVFGNLLGNALEAMAGGGSIHIGATAEKRAVVIRVRDTGPGIPPEIREHLFKPFVTARKPGGWGLGLAQARAAIIDHGGEIWLESSSGPGACFAFRLPIW
ncbi:MAG TPA: HAMP domain-containing sensor histidine kinase [Bryobacteraceae bacterium]|jgi:signal transduction histidine kinase